MVVAPAMTFPVEKVLAYGLPVTALLVALAALGVALFK